MYVYIYNYMYTYLSIHIYIYYVWDENTPSNVENTLHIYYII